MSLPTALDRITSMQLHFSSMFGLTTRRVWTVLCHRSPPWTELWSTWPREKQINTDTETSGLALSLFQKSSSAPLLAHLGSLEDSLIQCVLLRPLESTVCSTEDGGTLVEPFPTTYLLHTASPQPPCPLRNVCNVSIGHINTSAGMRCPSGVPALQVRCFS